MFLLKKFIHSVLLEKTMGEQPSHMIAAYPNEESIQKILEFRKQIKVPAGGRLLEPTEMHNTIRYWKNHVEKVPLAIKELKKYHISKPIIGKIKSIEILGDSLSFMLDSPIMHSTFKKIDDELTKLEIPPSDYPEYKPHMALYYFENPEETDVQLPDFDIVFDSIKLVDKDDNPIFEISVEK